MRNIHLIGSEKVASKSILESFMVYEREVYEKLDFQDHSLVIGRVLAIKYKQGKVKPKNKLVFSRMSTFQLHDGINDNKEGELSIDGFILSISRKPLANH